MFTAHLGETKLTDQNGGTDVYLDIYSDASGVAVLAFSTALHFDAPPGLGAISAGIAPLLGELNGADTTASKLAALNAAKGSPVTAPAGTPTNVFGKFAFRSLFTMSELVGIDNFNGNPSLNAGQKATLTTIIANYNSADTVTLTDPATQQGVGYLVSCGLLTQERAAAILSGTAPSGA